MSDLDCGDSSCMFNANRTGIRTNSGCRCFSNHGFTRSSIESAMMMLPEIIKLRDELAQSQARVSELLRDNDRLDHNLEKTYKNLKAVKDQLSKHKEALEVAMEGLIKAKLGTNPLSLTCHKIVDTLAKIEAIMNQDKPMLVYSDRQDTIEGVMKKPFGSDS